jgi:hypothetical protein
MAAEAMATTARRRSKKRGREEEIGEVDEGGEDDASDGKVVSRRSSAAAESGLLGGDAAFGEAQRGCHRLLASASWRGRPRPSHRRRSSNTSTSAFYCLLARAATGGGSPALLDGAKAALGRALWHSLVAGGAAHSRWEWRSGLPSPTSPLLLQRRSTYRRNSPSPNHCSHPFGAAAAPPHRGSVGRFSLSFQQAAPSLQGALFPRSHPDSAAGKVQLLGDAAAALDRLLALPPRWRTPRAPALTRTAAPLGPRWSTLWPELPQPPSARSPTGWLPMSGLELLHCIRL